MNTWRQTVALILDFFGDMRTVSIQSVYVHYRYFKTQTKHDSDINVNIIDFVMHNPRLEITLISNSDIDIPIFNKKSKSALQSEIMVRM